MLLTHQMTLLAALGGSLTALEGMMILLFVLVLSIFLGFEIITKVPPTLHTPLMSGTNAISGITIVGAIICADYVEVIWQLGSGENGHWAWYIMSVFIGIVAFLAVLTATINVIGGYAVTNRMLSMFKKKK